MKKKEYEEWIKLANELRHIRKRIYTELFTELKGVPKSTYDFKRVLDSFERMRSQLETRFALEHPDKFTPDIFYGPDIFKIINK